MPNRKEFTPLSSIDLDRLRRLHFDQKMSKAEIAAELGTSSNSVRKLMISIGIPTNTQPKYSVDEARHLYFDRKWTLQQIADKFGVTRQAVHLRLTNAGYDLRTAKTPKQLLEPGPLRELFVGQYLRLTDIAERLDTTIHYVKRAIREHGITRPPRFPKGRLQFDREVIFDLYVRQGLFIKDVAAILGTSRTGVHNELKRHNITFRHPPGTAIVRPDRKTLDELYTKQGLTFNEIACRLGISAGAVRKYVDKYGIRRRPALGLKAMGVSPDRLYELYVDHKMSVAEIARNYGVSTFNVYKYLNRHGIKLRPSFSRKRITLDAGLLKDLLVDQRFNISQTAKRFGVTDSVVKREALRHGLIQNSSTRS